MTIADCVVLVLLAGILVGIFLYSRRRKKKGGGCCGGCAGCSRPCEHQSDSDREDFSTKS